MKPQILPAKSDPHCLERCFLRIKPGHSPEPVFALEAVTLEDRFRFRTGLWGHSEPSDASQVMNYSKEQPGLWQPLCHGGRVREGDF